MAWRQITQDQISGRLTQSEQKMLVSISGLASKLSERLTDSINKFVGAMTASGYPVNTDGSVPDQLRNHVMADAIWELLKDAPNLKAFQTDQRKKAAGDAETAYEKICARNYGALESPTGTDISTGGWNSENKLIMRTHPIPAPPAQFQTNPFTSPDYANPNANVDSPTIVVSVPPTDLNAVAKQGKVSLTWRAIDSATSYKLYRGIAAGQETVPALVSVSGSSYDDSAVAAGTPYFYKITAVNLAGESALSNEVTATPT